MSFRWYFMMNWKSFESNCFFFIILLVNWNWVMWTQCTSLLWCKNKILTRPGRFLKAGGGLCFLRVATVSLVSVRHLNSLQPNSTRIVHNTEKLFLQHFGSAHWEKCRAIYVFKVYFFKKHVTFLIISLLIKKFNIFKV